MMLSTKDVKELKKKMETPGFLEYKRVTTGLKRAIQIFFILFLVAAFLIFFSIKIGEFTLGISDGYVATVFMIVFGIATTLFFREYLDIKAHGLEKYKQKWYYSKFIERGI